MEDQIDGSANDRPTLGQSGSCRTGNGENGLRETRSRRFPWVGQKGQKRRQEVSPRGPHALACASSYGGLSAKRFRGWLDVRGCPGGSNEGQPDKETTLRRRRLTHPHCESTKLQGRTGTWGIPYIIVSPADQYNFQYPFNDQEGMSGPQAAHKHADARPK